MTPRRAPHLAWMTVVAAIGPGAVGCVDRAGLACPPGAVWTEGGCVVPVDGGCPDGEQPAGCGGGDAGTSDGAVDAGPCAAPLIACGAACVDPRVDPSHCGGCGQRCLDGSHCEVVGAGAPIGQCVAGCTSNQLPFLMLCPVDGARLCVDTRSDPRNCGKCGVTCAAGLACCNRSCAAPGCP